MKNYMKSLLLIMAVMLCGGVCMACYSSNTEAGADKTVDVKRSVGYFSGIESNVSADIRFVQGKSPSVRIVGSKSRADNLSVETTGNTLVLRTKAHNNIMKFNMKKSSLTVYITSPDLTSVSLRGSGDFDATGDIDTDNLSVELLGSGDADFRNIICDNINISIQGSGDCEAKNIDTGSAVLNIYGSGDASFASLKARTVEFATYGSGDVKALLREVSKTSLTGMGSGDMGIRLDNCGSAVCSVAGSGDIILKGSLQSLEKSKKGSGDISVSGLRIAGN